MNNGINQNPMQDVNMQPMNMNGQPVELTPPADNNMVNMEQVMGMSGTSTENIAFDEKAYKMKKAAIYLFIIGALLIVMGIVYNVLGIGTGEETPAANNQTTTEEVAPEQGTDATTTDTTDTTATDATNAANTAENGVENRVATNTKVSLTCKLNNKSKTNGINQVLTYNFYENNGKLTGYDKKYDVIPITGHSNGIISVNKEIAKYDGLKAKMDNISGYIMSVASINNGVTETLTVRVNVNLDLFKNDLPNELKKNKVTNVEYNSNSNIKTIKKELTKSGYSC